MEGIDSEYVRDQNLSKYIEDHRHLLEQCSKILDDTTEDLDNANCKIHELEKSIEELKKWIKTVW
jgi:peptidoglycan hydrolase CwlO-like protein